MGDAEMSEGRTARMEARNGSVEIIMIGFWVKLDRRVEDGQSLEKDKG